MEFLNFFVGDNLMARSLTEAAPWDFDPPAETFEKMKTISKDLRRKRMVDSNTKWQVYSAIRAHNWRARVSKDNPPQALHGIVCDYDTVMNDEMVKSLIEQMPENLRPNFIETSLSGKKRLIWVFERSLMVHSFAYAKALLDECVKVMHLDTLLPGYDSKSTEPSQLWTNGVEWQPYKETPLSAEFVFGVDTKVNKRSELFGISEIPMEIIAAAVKEKFPNGWTGDFVLDAKGKRFWDPKADNPTGCQVKPDGMRCFTGPKSFVPWSEIFSAAWVDEQKVMNLGRAGAAFVFDGKDYFECKGPKTWFKMQEHAVARALQDNGLSATVKKGQTISEVQKVMRHIEHTNRVSSAAPYINRPSGVFTKSSGERILNLANLRPVMPAAGLSGNVEQDCEWIEKIHRGMLIGPDKNDTPYHVTTARLQRLARNIFQHESNMGQIIFLCGPAGVGKTLWTVRVVAGMFGGKFANPTKLLMGETDFSDDVWDSPVHLMNDEEAPKDHQRDVFLQKLKAAVVNPEQKYHAKYGKPANVEWCGGTFITLNNDPAAVGVLPEVNEYTHDKFCFMQAYPPAEPWPEHTILEAHIARELPAYVHYLLNVYEAPEKVRDPNNNRIGVKSWFDPALLASSQHQTPAHGLKELLQLWLTTAADGIEEWEGTPTRLISDLSMYEDMKPHVNKLTQRRVSANLTTLARLAGSGVYMDPLAHTFRIVRKEILGQ